MNWQIIISIITGIGIGTIISAYINIKYQRKKLIFETKLANYSSLIQSRNQMFAQQDQAAHQNFRTNLSRVELVGTDSINNLCGRLRDNVSDDAILNELVIAMRNDLSKCH